MDMVFLYKKEQELHLRRRRNASDPGPAPPAAPEPKSKDSNPAKKVPAGFNSTSPGSPADGVFPGEFPFVPSLGPVRKRHPRMFYLYLTHGALIREKGGIPFEKENNWVEMGDNGSCGA